MWAKSVASSKWMILDESPTSDGNAVLTYEPQYGRKVVTVYRDAAEAERVCPGEPRYLDHHVTCPQAKEWRARGDGLG